MAQIRAELLGSKKRKIFCLSTTANVANPPLYFTSIRETERTIAGSAMFSRGERVAEVVAGFAGLVDLLLVDTEVKNSITDLEQRVRHCAGATPVYGFKPNDLTVDALDAFLSRKVPDLRGVTVAVLGMGNLGGKISLRLLERGARVQVWGRNAARVRSIAQGLSLLAKGSGTIDVSALPERCLEGAQVVLGTSAGVPVWERGWAKKIQGLVIDVGNGCFGEAGIRELHAAGMEVYCLNFMPGYRGFLECFEATEALVFGLGRRSVSRGVNLITPGLVGRRGDILVDRLENWTRIVGVCDGTGGVLKNDEAAPFLERMKVHD
ncbi:MAG: hypothetical protein HUU37_02690 [Bdellovibrionales bacterium]|nr:hypothetical protein [Bdellovibrionales bacterium]